MNDAIETVRLSTLEGDDVTLDGEAVAAFGRGIRGSLCPPSDARYDELRRLFNGIFDRRPGLIVQCAGVSDVMKCVNLAREHNLLVTVRGGGHHVNGFASCDGGLMIDLSRMKSVRVDPAERTARAEAGCTLFDLDTECQAFGLAAPSGIVSNTGIAGLSLGGGLGWLMRSYGLTIDNIIEFDIITPDGQLLIANAEQNTDLYWALRGGGGNFGIVTSFKYRLYPIASVTAGWIYYPIEKAREVIGFYRDFVDRSSDRMHAEGVFAVLPDGAKSCAVALCYNGPAAEAADAIEPLRQFGVVPSLDDVRRMSYLELQSMMDQGPLPGLRYHQKDRFIAEITDELIDTIAANFEAAPVADGADSGLRVVAGFRFLAGAVNRVRPDETAFPRRERQFVLEIVGMWDEAADDDANIAWVEKLYADLTPFVSHGHYINGHMGSGEDFAREIYDPECYECLVSIKNKYDPGNMFRRNYNIKPTINPKLRS
jgi:FAD/FMN-containing dehydrogenase